MTNGIAYQISGTDDPGGYVALNCGAECYDKAMSYFDASDHFKRIASFHDAEGWYLQAAQRDNPYAYLNLGYVYSYDRCEGNYYVNADAAMYKRLQAVPDERRQRLAFDCYLAAAEMEMAEGCYKLGDMYKHGMGCNPNAQLAFRWYARACELSYDDEPAIWGSAALRLATCYENGFGCGQSFEVALGWYEKAVTGLEIAVRGGDWFYEKALAGARDGLNRCKQELAG